MTKLTKLTEVHARNIHRNSWMLHKLLHRRKQMNPGTMNEGVSYDKMEHHRVKAWWNRSQGDSGNLDVMMKPTWHLWLYKVLRVSLITTQGICARWKRVFNRNSRSHRRGVESEAKIARTKRQARFQLANAQQLTHTSCTREPGGKEWPLSGPWRRARGCTPSTVLVLKKQLKIIACVQLRKFLKNMNRNKCNRRRNIVIRRRVAVKCAHVVKVFLSV